jgi:hypothetical protein
MCWVTNFANKVAQEPPALSHVSPMEIGEDQNNLQGIASDVGQSENGGCKENSEKVSTDWDGEEYSGDSDVKCVSHSPFEACPWCFNLASTKVHYSEACHIFIKTCFSDLMVVVEKPGGLHPKMAAIIDSIFSRIENVGGNIGWHKRRRISQRTWKDSNGNMLYLD